jgi:mRNA interferase MazF
LRRGDVVLVQFPFTDLSASKLRPALVVARVSGTDLVLAFISSSAVVRNPRAERRLEPSDPEFAGTGLKVGSVIRLDRLATLSRILVARRLGHIGPDTERAVMASLRYLFELS